MNTFSMLFERIFHAKRYKLKVNETINEITSIILKLQKSKPKLEKLVQQLIEESQYKKECPKCHSTKITKIAYGYIDFDRYPEYKNKVCGGCCVGPLSPEYHCKSCHKEWNVNYTEIQRYCTHIDKHLQFYKNIKKLNLIELQEFLNNLVSLQKKLISDAFYFSPLEKAIQCIQNYF